MQVLKCIEFCKTDMHKNGGTDLSGKDLKTSWSASCVACLADCNGHRVCLLSGCVLGNKKQRNGSHPAENSTTTS